MSGHSKWHNIQAKKGKADAARGKIFTKLGRELLIAVKEGGPEPAGNSKLKAVIAKCKAANMPNDTINKATDTYKTYHIHVIKDNETVDSICQMYKSSKETIMEYNDLNDIAPGDKLIIPEDD